jgi:serine/threonine protein kinase
VVVANDGTALRQAREALLREVAAISRINHPGIVRFEDVFEANGTLCFAMDFVEGEPLSGLLARRRGVSADTFAKLATSLLDGVETLHTNDVLHGDIKPGNIILRSDKSVVILDFGTAARLTDMHYVEPILTPGYSAPERYVPNGDVGAWSDVYSCAATLSAAMAGRPPPELVDGGIDQSDMAAFLRAAGERFPDGARWCRGAELGLRKDASDRAASIADLRAAMGLAAASVDAAPAPAEGRGDGRSVFISYAHSDADIVEKLVRAIQRRGAGVWIDRQGIRPGSRAWGDEILKGMRGAQIVLLFSSARSMASDNVKDEVYLAKELRKPIVVARLDQAPFSDEILMFLTRTQHIPASEMEPPAFAAAIVDVLNTETALPA